MPDPDTRVTTCCWQWIAAKNDGGYGQFWYGGGMRRAHRVAWLLDGRPLPQKPLTLDHICRNTLCVRIDHLRVATKTQQQINRGLDRNNTSGVRGVHWNKERGKWMVKVKLNNKSHFGGYYDDLEEAAAAAQALRERLHGSTTKMEEAK
jgi:hypothetical protein